MCSIYDNLRKGLGNVSKDRCIFIFLTSWDNSGYAAFVIIWLICIAEYVFKGFIHS